MSDPQRPVLAHPVDQEPAPTTPWVRVELGGFFAGVAWLVVVPGLLLSLTHTIAPDHDTVSALAGGLVALAVPLILLLPDRTHRFAVFMLVGLSVTAVLVAVVVVVFAIMLASGEAS